MEPGEAEAETCFPRAIQGGACQRRPGGASQFSEQQLLDPEIYGDDADPDGDGVLNWMERNHGSDALEGDSTGIISIDLDDDFLRCIYTRHTGVPGQASVVCQAGTDMSGWDSPELEERVLTTVDGIETVEARFPRAGRERGFIRFKHMPETP